MLAIFLTAAIIGAWFTTYFYASGKVNKFIDTNQKIVPYKDKKWFPVARIAGMAVIGGLLYYFVAGGVIMIVAAGWTVLSWIGLVKSPIT